MMSATKVGLQLLEIDEKTFSETEKAIRAKPENVARIQKEDERIRASLETEKDVVQSKVELKMIWLEKIRQEGEVEKKLAGIVARSP